jgi:hypothetical protein
MDTPSIPDFYPHPVTDYDETNHHVEPISSTLELKGDLKPYEVSYGSFMNALCAFEDECLRQRRFALADIAAKHIWACDLSYKRCQESAPGFTDDDRLEFVKYMADCARAQLVEFVFEDSARYDHG